MKTVTQLDLFAARRERDRVLEASRKKSGRWCDVALVKIKSLPRTLIGEEFTGEELRIALIADGLDPPAHPNSWGAIVKAAIQLGIIEKTGRMGQMFSKRSHARMTPILRRCS